jgi:hypothetical protein
MPTSTLLQLVARGRQDVYLTDNPQMTFFKHVYRRYTAFAIESIPVEFEGTVDFGKRISVVIPKKADLLWSMFIEVDLPAVPPLGSTTRYWCNDIGHAMFQNSTNTTGALGPLSLTIPLRFWFCNSIGMALPLIALQAHPVRLIIHLRPFHQLWWSSTLGNTGTSCPPTESLPPTRFQLFCDYVYLDKEEQKRFAAMDHEYLIEQVQYTPIQSIVGGALKATVDLNFNHCLKEMFWVVQQDRMEDSNEWFNYSNVKANSTIPTTKTDLLSSAILRLDGYDRFEERYALYFRRTQPYQYHTAIPSGENSFIYIYSFCLRPEAEQPSGSINVSRIDDVRLSLTFPTGTVSSLQRHVIVYARNYNVLRITGGLGGVLFYT